MKNEVGKSKTELSCESPESSCEKFSIIILRGWVDKVGGSCGEFSIRILRAMVDKSTKIVLMKRSILASARAQK